VDAQIAVTGQEELIIATVEFMKDGPEGAVFGGRRVTVQVGTDEDGKAITSCLVEDVDPDEVQSAVPAKSRGRPAKKEQEVLEALKKAISQAGVEFHPSSTSDPVRAVTVEVWRESYYESDPVNGDGKSTDTRKKAFGRGVKS